MRYKFNIQQFAEGGDAGEAGAEAPAENADAEAEAAAKHAEEWHNHITGEFREDYQKAVKEHVDRRFKHQAEMEEELERNKKLVSFLSEKYHSDDPQELIEAMMNDDALFEKEAAERGLSTEQYREVIKLQTERNDANARLEEYERQQAANATISEWVRQAEIVKQVFGDFDLESELANEQFETLLKNGVDVMTAYKVCHVDDVIQNAMRTTAQTVSEKITDSVRTKGLRPLENGIGKTSQPVDVKVDPSKLSINEMREIERRAARGERVTFR